MAVTRVSLSSHLSRSRAVVKVMVSSLSPASSLIRSGRLGEIPAFRIARLEALR